MYRSSFIFQGAAAFTFLAIVSFSKILQPFSGTLNCPFLIALTGAAQQQHNGPIDIGEVDAQPNPSHQAHFEQAAAKRRTVAEVIVLFDGS